MVDLIMVKRRARAGEVGLFVNAEVFEEDFSHIKMDAEVTVKATVKATQKYNKFSWHIANLVADASEAFDTKEDARDHILIECRHFRRRFDKLRDKAEVTPKPTHTLDGTEWLRLIRRMVHVAVTQFGIPEEALSRQIKSWEDSPMAQNEPPPYDEIPEGPGTTAPIEPEEPQDAPDDEPPMMPRPAAKLLPDAAPSREGVVQTIEMTGDPDWRIDTPGDAGSYAAYCRFHIDTFKDHAACIIWFNSEESWNLRKACKVGVSERKQSENYIASKFK